MKKRRDNKWSLTFESLSIGNVLRVLLLIVLMIGVGFAIGRFAKGGKVDEEAQEVIQTVDSLSITPTIEGEAYSLTVSHVESMVTEAAELTTTKYYYTDAVLYANSKEAFGVELPLTTDVVVFTYDGVVSVGVDLNAITCDVDNENKTITITLPEVGIIAHEIDPESFDYPYVSDTIFNSTQMEDYTEKLGELKEKTESDILADEEFMATALANTKNILEKFILNSELTDGYTVVFAEAE